MADINVKGWAYETIFKMKGLGEASSSQIGGADETSTSASYANGMTYAEAKAADTNKDGFLTETEYKSYLKTQNYGDKDISNYWKSMASYESKQKCNSVVHSQKTEKWTDKDGGEGAIDTVYLNKEKTSYIKTWLDASGKVVKMETKDLDGNKTVSNYNEDGKVESEKEYDINGNLTKETKYDYNSAGEQEIYSQMTVDGDKMTLNEYKTSGHPRTGEDDWITGMQKKSTVRELIDNTITTTVYKYESKADDAQPIGSGTDNGVFRDGGKLVSKEVADSLDPIEGGRVKITQKDIFGNTIVREGRYIAGEFREEKKEKYIPPKNKLTDTYTYEYDNTGAKIKQTQVSGSGDKQTTTETVFGENGNYAVSTVKNKDGKITKEITYKEKGVPSEEVRYSAGKGEEGSKIDVYIYNTEDESKIGMLESKTTYASQEDYENDVYSSQSIYTGEGNSNDDRTKTVSKTKDSDGKVITTTTLYWPSGIVKSEIKKRAGVVISEIRYNESGKMIYKVTRDNAGKLLTLKETDSEGRTTHEIEQAKGGGTKENKYTYNDSGTKLTTYIKITDQNGNITSLEERDPEHPDNITHKISVKDGKTTEMEYSYDASGKQYPSFKKVTDSSNVVIEQIEYQENSKIKKSEFKIEGEGASRKETTANYDIEGFKTSETIKTGEGTSVKTEDITYKTITYRNGTKAAVPLKRKVTLDGEIVYYKYPYNENSTSFNPTLDDDNYKTTEKDYNSWS